MALRRFTDGISNVAASNPLGNMPFFDPTKYAVFFDDFLAYDKTQLIAGVPYTLTVENACVDTIIGPTGVLVLTCGGADNDSGQLQTVEAPFQLSSTKKFFFETKIKVDKATGTIGEQEFFVGLASLQTTTNFMAADGLSRTMDDAIGFISYDGSANVDCLQGENDVYSTSAAATTYADVTWMVLSAYSDGVTTTFYKDDVALTTLNTNPPTSVVAPTLYIKAGEAKGTILYVDYIFASLER